MNFVISIAFLALIVVSCDAKGPPPISTTTVAAAAAATTTTTATNPAIINWIKSTGYNGDNNQLADVQKVQYSINYVYVTSTSIPGPYPRINSCKSSCLV
jgi:sensor histidine kinase regulating citrate/malate metabolism